MDNWPADKVERWPIERLVPYARNARTHSDGQIAQVAASIREWGWTNPVLIGEDGGIIAGHCRVLAARQLGLAEVPVMLATGWTDAQKRAYVLVDNQLAMNAEWNPDLLQQELGELTGMGFDLPLLGFSLDELTDRPASVSLAERFGIPPFSVLNAREGWWQDRKKAWIALGIQSELGRGDTAVNGMADGLVAVRAKQKARKANAIPGGGQMPLDRHRDARRIANARR